MLALIPLFVIAVTGSISLFHEELQPWTRPELRRPAAEGTPSADAALAGVLPEIPEDVQRINLRYPSEYAPLLRMDWRAEGDEDSTRRAFDPATGQRLGEPSSKLSSVLFRWHFLAPLPQGLLLAGLISLFWLALTISGVYLHRKKLLAQFRLSGWRKRRGRALQSWMHTLAATITLPFHLLYGVTGALFGSLLFLGPMILYLVFGGDQEAMEALVEGAQPPKQELAEETLDALPSLDPFVADAEARFVGMHASFVSLVEPYDEAARLSVFVMDAGDARGNVVYDLHRGMEPVHLVPPDLDNPVLDIVTPVIELHFAQLGGYPVRFLYLVLGVMLAVLIYAGARMWVMRQRTVAPRAAAACERLFDGFGFGLLPAIGVFAWANRLLPADLGARAQVEENVFHAVWVLVGLAVLVRGTGPATRRAMAMAAAVLLATVPLLDGLLHGMWPWSPSAWH
ncbi:MAG: PepSY-associated TM helix domain-containing protein, partial [Myxococcota bacterium]